MPHKSLLVLLLTLLFFSACTISTNQQPIGAVSPQALNTLAPSGDAGSNASGRPTPHSIPVAWSGLDLTGKLIFPISTSDGNNNYMDVQELDLLTGGITTIFQSVPDGWIDSVVISPDHKQIVMTYSTPALQQGAHFTPLGLFTFPIDGSQPPQELVPLPLKDDQFLQPVWSPDGKYVYYVLANYGLPPEEPNQHFPIDQIFRVAFPKGQPEKLLEKAYWPRLSADGSRLIYVSENPDDGTNKLYMANSDGSNPQQIMLTGTNAPTIIDAPIFLPDGMTILFSAPTPVQSSASQWLEWLFGVMDVSAHTIPSDWWSVPLGGGEVTRLTHIQAASLYASISPDNRYIASFSGDGVFVMSPDGSNLTMMIGNLGGSAGTVNWIP